MQENFPRSRYNLEFHILSFTTLAEIQTYRKITRRATNYAYSGKYRRINSVPLLNRALGKTTWFARATSRLSEPSSTLNIRFNARALMGSVPNPCVILPLWAIHKYVRAQSGMCEASDGDTASLTYGYVMWRKIRFSAVCGLSNFVPIAHHQLMRFREPGLNRAYAMPMMTVSAGSRNPRPDTDIEKVRTLRQEMYLIC